MPGMARQVGSPLPSLRPQTPDSREPLSQRGHLLYPKVRPSSDWNPVMGCQSLYSLATLASFLST